MIVHPRSVFARETDALQAARGILRTAIVLAVIWGVGAVILVWALP